MVEKVEQRTKEGFTPKDAEPRKPGKSYSAVTLVEALNSNEIDAFPNNMRRLCALFGITAFNWRPSVIERLSEAGISTFDPTADYDSNINPDIERRALVESGLISIRLEGKPGYSNIGLASLTEVGYSVLSAALRGQTVVVSIDKSFETTLETEYAKRMYSHMKARLLEAEHVLKSVGFDNLTILVNEKGDEEHFVNTLIEKYGELENKRPVNLDPIVKRFASLRKLRMEKPNKLLVDGGASAAFSEELTEQMLREKDLILEMFDENTEKISLYRPPYNTIWKIIDGSSVPQSQMDDFYTMLNRFDIDIPLDIDLILQESAESLKESEKELLREFAVAVEQVIKDEADIVFWTAQNESKGFAAVVENPYNFLKALLTGQRVFTFHEQFNLKQYIETTLLKPEVMASLEQEIQSIGRDEAAHQKALTVYAALELAMDGNWSGFMTENGQVNEKLFQKSAVKTFNDIDNIVRVRSTASSQLEGLKDLYKTIIDQYGVEIGYISTDIADLIQRVQMPFEGREQFLASYIDLKSDLHKRIKVSEFIVQNINDDENRDGFLVKILQDSMFVINPYQFKGLSRHLESARTFANRYNSEIFQRIGEVFLSKRQLELIERVIAPLHDIMKFLDANQKNVQVIPDHEILIGLILNEVMPSIGYKPEEVQFVVEVIRDHENIFKEFGRTGFASSKNAIQRGKAHFFVIDTLTDGLVFYGDLLTISQKEVNARFVDLYYRHMDKMAIRNKKLPSPRPEWGLTTLQDWFAYFDALKEKGLNVDPQIKVRLAKAGIMAIDRALKDHQDRMAHDLNSSDIFSPEEESEVLKVREKIVEMQQESEQIAH